MPGLMLAGIISLAAGCATQPGGKTAKNVFYPPAPDEPRVQWLASYGSEKDFRGTGHDTFMKFITGEEPANTPISKPYGGAAAKDNFYVCDTSVGMVLRLDLKARRMFAIAPTGPGAFKLPVNLAVDGNGWLYIADSSRNQVVILDEKEALVGTIGEKGSMEPRDVALTKDRIYIGDRLNHCIHVYDKAARTNLFDIPRLADATNLNAKLFQPINLALDKDGRLYVADFGAYRVQVYDADGKYLRSVGKNGDNYGEFARLKGIAVDRDNLLYAVDAAGQIVQMFDESGRLLMWFGQPNGAWKGLNLPSKVFLDYDNVGYFQKFAAPDFQIDHLVVVISQYGSKKVNVFGFGHKK
jgi:hypothetical protein